MPFKFMLLSILVAISASLATVPSHAQDLTSEGQIIFQTGTGEPQPARLATPVRTARMACAELPAAQERLFSLYGKWDVPIASPEFAEAARPPMLAPTGRLDRQLFQTALSSYRRHNCLSETGSGPSDVVIVDFAKPSSEPRLYIVNLLTGQGIDTPIRVAHGIGSDPNDDGIADRFSNVYNSLASSLGAARGAELYVGQNGLSLRLDGLDFSNSQMRVRDIVAHSYAPQRRRYFNASLLAVRGRPGTSEGCFVVAPEHRDWLFSILRDGGFLFAGLGGERAKDIPVPSAPIEPIVGDVVFVPGTGASPTDALP